MGLESHLTIELGCTTLVDTVRLKNLATERGTNEFSIEISQTDTGPWTELVTARIEQFKVSDEASVLIMNAMDMERTVINLPLNSIY